MFDKMETGEYSGYLKAFNGDHMCQTSGRINAPSNFGKGIPNKLLVEF